ncbi:MAG: flagellar hook-associated protein FlgK [Pseudomonadota bacterium]
MSLTGALQNAVSGLVANGRQLSVTSDNIANALTPGFATRRTVLTTRPDAIGGGVNVSSVERATDPALSALRRAADASAAEANVYARGMERIASSVGELGDPDGLFERQVAFEESLAALADNPESEPRQQNAVSDAMALASKLNELDTSARAVRESADADIARIVGRINQATEDIAALNREIQRAESLGRDTTALQDRRELLIDEVSAALPVKVTYTERRGVELYTEQGLLLVGSTARLLEFAHTPVIGPEMIYDAGGGALSGLNLNGLDIAPGSGSAQAIESGALAGAFRLRDEAGPELQQRIDGFAEDLVDRLAAPGIDPTTGPGDPGLFTDNGSAATDPVAPGIAGRIEVNAAVTPETGAAWRLRDGLGSGAPGSAGDDTILRSLLAGLREPSTASGNGVAANMRERAAFIAEAGTTERFEASEIASFEQTRRETLADQEAQVRAVDTDRELQQLITIEQAYAANAQVIQAAARMLDELGRIG